MEISLILSVQPKTGVLLLQGKERTDLAGTGAGLWHTYKSCGSGRTGVLNQDHLVHVLSSYKLSGLSRRPLPGLFESLMGRQELVMFKLLRGFYTNQHVVGHSELWF